MFGQATFAQVTFAQSPGAAGPTTYVLAAVRGLFVLTGEVAGRATIWAVAMGSFVFTGKAVATLKGAVLFPTNDGLFGVTGYSTIMLQRSRQIFVRMENYVLKQLRSVRGTLKD